MDCAFLFKSCLFLEDVRPKIGLGFVTLLMMTGSGKCANFSSNRHYYWDEPYLYKRGPDSIYRRCIAEEDVQGVLEHCHGSAYGGTLLHSKPQKVLQAGMVAYFVQDAASFIANFMGPFNPSNGHNYILVAVDYVSKWMKPSCPACDAKVVIKLFRTIIFPRYGIPRVVISDGGSHFINKCLRS
ncbi:unnamed protein product [Microthlaspi erraticum]|uniref:Integrase catalytic domain-containing protein n=1 Tax=Microthlaspi erraticum TaxID=1685480 RepID=A0A6D2I930_9BRAS|nr:unnamed protein product [Microthlaspi erraticum]